MDLALKKVLFVGVPSRVLYLCLPLSRVVNVGQRIYHIHVNEEKCMDSSIEHWNEKNRSRQIYINVACRNLI